MKDNVRQWLAEQFGDDAETISTVWDEYLSSAAEKIAEARVALEASDFPLLNSIAHALKGNALVVGDQELAAAGIALGEAAAASSMTSVAKALDWIERVDRENR